MVPIVVVIVGLAVLGNIVFARSQVCIGERGNRAILFAAASLMNGYLAGFRVGIAELQLLNYNARTILVSRDWRKTGIFSIRHKVDTHREA